MPGDPLGAGSDRKRAAGRFDRGARLAVRSALGIERVPDPGTGTHTFSRIGQRAARARGQPSARWRPRAHCPRNCVRTRALTTLATAACGRGERSPAAPPARVSSASRLTDQRATEEWVPRSPSRKPSPLGLVVDDRSLGQPLRTAHWDGLFASERARVRCGLPGSIAITRVGHAAGKSGLFDAVWIA